MRRENLANRKDLEAKQEIKNYKNTVLSQNLAMNGLRDQISSLSNRIESRCSFLESKLESVERGLSSLELSDNKFREDIKRSIGDISSLLNKVGLKSDEIEVCLNEDCLAIEEIEGRLEFLADRQYKGIEERRLSKESINHDISQLRLFLIGRMDSIKCEILSRPSELDPIKESLNKELSIYKVNFDGVVRELEASKRSVYIMQKEIENIYNTMKRSN